VSGFVETIPAVLHWIALACLAIFGIHRYVILVLYLRTRRHAPRALPVHAWPRVTVQLPLYNERHVAERLIDAVCALDYPRDRFEVQVLDDSTDDTREIVTRAVERHARAGVRITNLRRGTRRGFKAGALDHGLRATCAELVAIFDADFIPGRDFLRRTVAYFAAPSVGAVQARWGYTNRRYSLLTRVQALMLDGHFLLEHTARSRSGRFFNFNGTAGVWRAEAIRSAGGWQHDTLTEDLDLSYRAQLAGWRFVYVVDAVCPSELPDEMGAFQSQQFRWAKGSVQTGRKLLARVWRARLPLRVKIEASFHLMNNVAYLLMALPVFLALPLVLTSNPALRIEQISLYCIFFLLASVSVGVYYAVTAHLAGMGAWRGIALLPFLMAIGVGMTVNNGAAVIDALRGRVSPFVRTPKYSLGEARATGERRWYRPERSARTLLEALLAMYLLGTLGVTWHLQLLQLVPVLLLFVCGFAWVAGASLRESRP
jgi:cellulose synthase/poly-beta-1,6-N-acetylglucosamine synthase-like glycosyltransferase